MSETLPVIDMPVNIDMDVNKGKMLLEILQNAAKFNHGFSFGAGGPGGVPASPATPGVPTGTFNPVAIPGAGSPGNGRGIASRAGNAMLNTVIAPFILLGKTTALTTKSVKIFGTALKKTTSVLQGIFTSVLRWSLGLTAVAGGGMFGYSRMAKGVSNDFNASMGLGVSTAFNKAFNTVWGNKLDGAGEFLNAVSMAKGDPGSEEAKTLLGLGINPNGDVQANTMAALRSAWAFARQHKDSTSGKRQFDDLYGGLTLGGVGFNQLGSMDEKEYNEYQDMLTKQIKNNQISEQTQRSFQDLMIQLEGNMTSLGSTFVEMLKGLNPQILKFSNAITKNLNEFMTGNGKDLFTEIGKGLEWFTAYISKPAFKEDIKNFLDGISAMGRLLWKVVNYFGPDDGSAAGSTPWMALGAGAVAANAFIPGVSKLSAMGGRYAGTVLANGMLSSPVAMTAAGMLIPTNNTPNQTEEDKEKLRLGSKNIITRIGMNSNLPKNMLETVAEIETGFRPWEISTAGAMGPFQWTKETGNRWGLHGNDFFDPQISGEAAERFFQAKLKDYNGSIAKSLIAFHSGEGAIKGNELTIGRYGIDYLLKALKDDRIPDMRGQHPGLTAQLVKSQRWLATQPAGTRVTIELKNAPGSDINTQVTSSLATASAMRFNGIPK